MGKSFFTLATFLSSPNYITMNTLNKLIAILLPFLVNCAMFNSISQSSQSSQSVSSSLQSISTLFNSVSSISGSIASISTSSSKNNDDGQKKSQYKRDVRDVTYLSLKSGNTGNLGKDLEKISLRHGISDWRKEESAFVGIGEGLKKAGKTHDDLSFLASSLSEYHFKSLRNGYEN